MNAPHYTDEYVEVTAFGQIEPQYMLARTAIDQHLAWARAMYLAERIDEDEFENEIAAALRRPKPRPKPKPKPGY